jgi:hypothetical protein
MTTQPNKFPFKECRKCKELKPLESFYRHSKMKDGHLNYCKECVKCRTSRHYHCDVTKHRFEESERYQRRRESLSFIQSRKEYYKRYMTPERIKIKNARRTPERMKANSAAQRSLTKEAQCEICDKRAKTHAHHHDYSRPLDVIWCCPKCHSQLHVGNKRISA